MAVLKRELRPTVATMIAVLGAWATTLFIQHRTGLSSAVDVLAVSMALTLSRSQRGADARGRVTSLATVPVIALAAGEVGTLVLRHPLVGDPLFTIGLTTALWVRRFGPRAAKLGGLASLPFLALLITPVPPGSGHLHELWSVAVAVVAFLWVTAAQLALGVTGPALAARPRPSRRGLAPTTRMALQLGVALGLAFVLGRLILPDHWPWMVLTAFVVSSGNRGRGDVVYKGVLRLAGAVAGTVVATVIGTSFAPHDPAAVVAIFVLLAIALWLRPLSYAYWAAGVTGVLALLYGYYGAGGTAMLPERVGGIAIGAVIAVAAAWFVFPLRSSDVIRARCARALGAIRDTFGDDADAERRLEDALHELALVRPAAHAQRRVLGRWLERPCAADVIDAVAGCEAGDGAAARAAAATYRHRWPER